MIEKEITRVQIGNALFSVKVETPVRDILSKKNTSDGKYKKTGVRTVRQVWKLYQILPAPLNIGDFETEKDALSRIATLMGKTIPEITKLAKGGLV